MSGPAQPRGPNDRPGQPDGAVGDTGVEVFIHRGRRRVRAGRWGAAVQTRRMRLRRARRWLISSRGRRAALRTVQGLTVGVAVLGGGVLLRRWVAQVGHRVGALTSTARQAAETAGAVGVVFGRVLGLRWLARPAAALLHLLGRRTHRHCVDCHARIRADARVCYRCGAAALGPLQTRGRGERRARGSVAALRWVWRAGTLTLFRRCEDCRRLVHADARRCHFCSAPRTPASDRRRPALGSRSARLRRRRRRRRRRPGLVGT